MLSFSFFSAAAAAASSHLICDDVVEEDSGHPCCFTTMLLYVVLSSKLSSDEGLQLQVRRGRASVSCWAGWEPSSCLVELWWPKFLEPVFPAVNLSKISMYVKYIVRQFRRATLTTLPTNTNTNLQTLQPSIFISFEYYVFVPSHSVNLKGERQQKYTNRTENHETTQKVLLAVHPASGAHGTNHRGRTISQTSTSSSRRRSIRYRHRWITFTRASNVISDNEFVPNS